MGDGGSVPAQEQSLWVTGERAERAKGTAGSVGLGQWTGPDCSVRRSFGG